jgi:hypothetical protein
MGLTITASRSPSVAAPASFDCTSFNISHREPVEWHHKPTTKYMKVYRVDQKPTIEPPYLKAAILL